MTFHKILLFQLNIAPVNSCITANLLKFKIRKHKVTADKNLVERKPMSHDSNTSIFFDSAASTSSKTGEEQLVSERRPKSSNCLSNWRRYKYSSSPLFLRDSLISSQIFSKSSSSSSLMMAWTVSFRAHALWRIWRSGDNTHTHTSKYGHSFHGKTSVSSSSVLPEGSLSGLYSRAFCEMRSVSSRNSLTVLYWWRSILERTVDKSIGFLITSA